VNLTSGEQMKHLIKAFDGHSGWSPRLAACSKVCKVTPAKTQGLAANTARYRNSPLMCDEVPERFKPAVFVGGQQAAFPEPTCRSSRIMVKSLPRQPRK